MAGTTEQSTGGAQALEPDAFKKLYPEQFYQRFIESGVRPDGRPFGRARPTTIGLDTIGTADSSALVKIGSTTAIAGVKLEVLAPTGERCTEGQLIINVETTPMCSAGSRPGRQADIAQCCNEQVQLLLTSSETLDLSKLTFGAEKNAWVAYLDIYVLDLDGGLLDTCLLAAVAALAALKQLPDVHVDEQGQVVQSAEEAGTDEAMLANDSVSGGLVNLERMPISLTCGFYKGKLIADPTAEEEVLMQSTVTATVDSSGCLIGLYKPGGTAEASTSQLQECIEAAKLRYRDVTELLDQSLSAVSQA